MLALPASISFSGHSNYDPGVPDSQLAISESIFWVSRFSLRCNSLRLCRYSFSAALLILSASCLASSRMFFASILASASIRTAFLSAIRCRRPMRAPLKIMINIPPSTVPMIKAAKIPRPSIKVSNLFPLMKLYLNRGQITFHLRQNIFGIVSIRLALAGLFMPDLLDCIIYHSVIKTSSLKVTDHLPTKFQIISYW